MQQIAVCLSSPGICVVSPPHVQRLGIREVAKNEAYLGKLGRLTDCVKLTPDLVVIGSGFLLISIVL